MIQNTLTSAFSYSLRVVSQAKEAVVQVTIKGFDHLRDRIAEGAKKLARSFHQYQKTKN